MRIDRIKLISEMARRDLTVLKLAELSGVSRMTITSVRGGKTCSESTAKKLAAGLGVDPSELIAKEGE